MNTEPLNMCGIVHYIQIIQLLCEHNIRIMITTEPNSNMNQIFNTSVIKSLHEQFTSSQVVLVFLFLYSLHWFTVFESTVYFSFHS